ncbi:MAG TPA: GNAT family N-acetyltransferase [Candidatus Dormibacteraeota bacterium]|nr:GNAT family N-acetyltransferase [Candidatus Dormibacteraeota bacterium]
MTLRPVRPADRDRILEITRDVWGGRDYLPEVFDAWVADPGGTFQAAEVEGEVVGVQRLRPIAPGIALYEGLRVASTHRRRGIARSMLRQALEQARSLGLRQVRLYTDSEAASRLFASEGFRLVTACAVWNAGRMEGDDLPRLARPGEGAALAARLRQEPEMAKSLQAYQGVNPDWSAVVDVDADLLERLAGEGRVRLGPGGRALALLRTDLRSRLLATFVAGSGAALQELMIGLRFEADGQGLHGATALLPDRHPGIEDLRQVGYDLADDEGRAYVYALDL